MTLIYESEFCQLHQGDSREILPTLEKNVSLIVTDPPYGVSYVSGFGSFDPIAGDDSTDVGEDVLTRALRLLRTADLHVYVFGPFDMGRIRQTSTSVDLVWNKGGPGMGNLSSPFGTSHERIAFSRANVSRSTGIEGLSERKRKGSVLSYPRKGGAAVRHPTEKPVGLLRELVESSSISGDVVLDPFMGVGSTAVAAILLGRKFVGIELDEGYADIAVERCKAAERAWKAMQGI